MEENLEGKEVYLEGYYNALDSVEELTQAGHQISWILEFLRKD